MTLREIIFGSNDYQSECLLRQEVLRKPLGLDLYDENLEQERNQRHFGLFDDGGSLIGCAVVVPLSLNEARIRQMAVAAHCQSHGHGRLLLEEVEQHLASLGFNRFIVHARLSAVSFYEKLGYSTVGDTYWEVSIPHVTMEKRLLHHSGGMADVDRRNT